MKIAILGGSFDPPHIGHFLIATQIIEQADIDEVWLLPNYTTTTHHKVFQKNMSPAPIRLEMAKLLQNEKIKVSDFEIENNKDSITIITLKLLSKKYPEHKFYWITGSDKLEDFQKYDDWEDLVHKYNLIIFPREHMLWNLEDRVKQAFNLQQIPQNIIVLANKDLVLSNVSSSIIRERVKKGLSIKYLVPENVQEFIKKNNLYGN